MKTILCHPSIAAHSPTILLVTPPPVNEIHLRELDPNKGFGELSRQLAITAQYAEAIRELAAEFKDRNVVLIDLWTAIMKHKTQLTGGYTSRLTLSIKNSSNEDDDKAFRELLVDGLHLTGAGYRLFLNEVLLFIQHEWKKPGKVPRMIFP